MKKMFALLMALTMTASLLAGCGSSAAPAASAVASTSASASASGAKYNTGMPELDSILNNATGRLADILAAGKITCVSEVAFAPYEFVDPDISNEQDSYVGSDMELARYIASCLGVKLEIDNVVWDAVATGVQDGKYDMAISGMLYTEERAEAMDLSDIYVTDETNVQTFIVPKDKVNDYTQLSDFDGKRIAYQMGTVQQELVNNQLKNPVTSEFSSVQDAVLALQSGKCDAVAIAYQVGLPMVEANKDLVISDVNFIYDKNGLVVACKKGESDLVAAINVIIADEISKGLYTDWTTAAQARVKELGL
ncbi:transporter substrate-binding domain-containing protein [Oscillibacter sp.]|uniref:transporter substrate-binding domain-containing protein n=1 Tax=Oscillibacter sp. TaxID=1945593 RepID=UPI0033920381